MSWIRCKDNRDASTATVTIGSEAGITNYVTARRTDGDAWSPVGQRIGAGQLSVVLGTGFWQIRLSSGDATKLSGVFISDPADPVAWYRVVEILRDPGALEKTLVLSRIERPQEPK